MILTYLEKQLQAVSKSDLKIGEDFDFVAGTSTGGILACIYLVPDSNRKARYSAHDAVNLYLQDGQSIFPTTLFEEIMKLYSFFEPKYAAAPLEKILEDFFGDIMLGELIKPCLITSYEIVERAAVFFTSADATEPFKNYKVKDVARATSAAPTYFQPAHIASEAGRTLSLIDGGVYANNPALCAYAEARKTTFSTFLKDSEKTDLPTAKDMLIVSLGTGTVKKPYHYKDFKNAGELKWLQPIIDILTSGNSETVDYQLRQMYKALPDEAKNDYYRLEPPLHEACPELDKATPDNLENLRQAGLTYIDKNKDLLNEIANKVLQY
ncbi:MAG: patatin-like phospholipase family protein [Chitinophagaceae bacterium]